MPSSANPSIAPAWYNDWPELDRALDPETIERYAHDQLYRALNIKQLIAFVGSGVSMAYGRVSWSELARVHLEIMCANLSSNPRRGNLLEYLRVLRKRPDDLYSEQLYAALQACELMWRHEASDSDEHIEKLAEAFGFDWEIEDRILRERRINGEERGSFLFRKWIKRETYDELAHSRRLIHGWQSKRPTKDELWIPKRIVELAVSLKDELTTAQKELEGARALQRGEVGQHPQQYLIYFKREFLAAVESASGELLTALKDHPVDEVRAIARQFRAVAQASVCAAGGKYLHPVRGFGVGFVLDLARLLFQLNQLAPSICLPSSKGWDTGSAQEGEASKEKGKKPSEHLNHVERMEQVPANSDPLYNLAYKLGVRRFLTTNYDLEIERLFVNMGFAVQDNSPTDGSDIDDVEMVGPSGGRTRDFVLTKRSAIDLVDFAANESPHDFQVVHLHGRATDNHDIVITEGDYQRTYVREITAETAVREGIEIAFGGSPILFVGMSLGEGDVLRPLREFMTSSSRRNHAIVALRDGRETEVKRHTFAKTAYSRYGVLVIHYGRVTSKEDDYIGPSWLAAVHKINDSLTKTVESLAELIEEGFNNKESIREFEDALNALTKLHHFRSIKGKVHKSKKVWSIATPFESDNSPCDVSFEIKILDALKTLAEQVAKLATPTRLSAIAPKDRKNHRNAVANFLRVSIRGAAERAETAILTAALNAKLLSLKAGWDGWWRDWRALPASRSEHSWYEASPNEDAYNIWGRYIAVGDYPSAEIPSAALDKFLAVVPWAPPNGGRRIFVLVGAPGSGKGNVFNALWRRGNEILRQQRRYVGQFFATFSFSIEIASVWDGLVAFLHDPRRPQALAAPPYHLAEEATDEQLFQMEAKKRRALGHLSRVDALRRVLFDLADRLLLLEKSGHSGPQRLLIVLNSFDVLLDEHGQPKNDEIRQVVDLLIGEGEQSASPYDLVILCRDTGIPPQFRPAREKSGSRQLHLLPTSEQRQYGRTEPGSDTYQEFVKIIQHSGVQVDVSSSHKWFDAELGMQRRRRRGTKGTIATENYLHVHELPDPVNFDWPPFSAVKQRLGECTARAMREVDRAGWTTTGESEAEEALNRLFSLHLERRRFLYTLVVGIANHVANKRIEDFEGRPSSPEDLDKKKNDELAAFLKRLIAALRGPGGSVQDRTVEIVLDYLFEEFSSSLRTKSHAPDRDPILHEALLRHLAVIGTPVRPDVLTICPQVRRRLDVLCQGGGKPEERAKILAKCLAALGTYGLVFSIRPSGTTNAADTGNRRYVVHRAVQRYVFRKLGSQRLEPSEGQLFTVSLYASQQRQLPRLNSAAYEFVYELVRGLCAYPSGRPSPHGTDKELASRSLRAALGVTRNLFSIGVVSRLSDVGGVRVTTPERFGYFEHHRLIVRWMLNYARHLYAPAKLSEWPPFYRDELVWLANECGVFLHAQGQIHDATALFWFARRITRDIENLGTGVLRSRILLNDAWCSVDRARLDDAERRFQNILEMPNQEETLHLLATGGMARIAHLRGRLDIARRGYESAIRGLGELQRSRPVAEFQRNLGDLLRHYGRHNQAETELMKAVQIADAGGYMELVHHAQVARVRNAIESGGADVTTFIELLNMADEYAEKMDLARLLCEVLMVRALLLIRNGHSIVAGPFVTRAIRIATLSGLSLRKIAYLELLVKIERNRGGRESAERLRARTIQAAQNVGYNLVVDRAERDSRRNLHVAERTLTAE